MFEAHCKMLKYHPNKSHLHKKDHVLACTSEYLKTNKNNLHTFTQPSIGDVFSPVYFCHVRGSQAVFHAFTLLPDMHTFMRRGNWWSLFSFFFVKVSISIWNSISNNWKKIQNSGFMSHVLRCERQLAEDEKKSKYTPAMKSAKGLLDEFTKILLCFPVNL